MMLTFFLAMTGCATLASWSEANDRARIDDLIVEARALSDARAGSAETYKNLKDLTKHELCDPGEAAAEGARDALARTSIGDAAADAAVLGVARRAGDCARPVPSQNRVYTWAAGIADAQGRPEVEAAIHLEADLVAERRLDPRLRGALTLREMTDLVRPDGDPDGKVRDLLRRWLRLLASMSSGDRRQAVRTALEALDGGDLSARGWLESPAPCAALTETYSLDTLEVDLALAGGGDLGYALGAALELGRAEASQCPLPRALEDALPGTLLAWIAEARPQDDLALRGTGLTCPFDEERRHGKGKAHGQLWDDRHRFSCHGVSDAAELLAVDQRLRASGQALRPELAGPARRVIAETAPALRSYLGDGCLAGELGASLALDPATADAGYDMMVYECRLNAQNHWGVQLALSGADAHALALSCAAAFCVNRPDSAAELQDAPSTLPPRTDVSPAPSLADQPYAGWAEALRGALGRADLVQTFHRTGMVISDPWPSGMKYREALEDHPGIDGWLEAAFPLVLRDFYEDRVVPSLVRAVDGPSRDGDAVQGRWLVRFLRGGAVVERPEGALLDHVYEEREVSLRLRPHAGQAQSPMEYEENGIRSGVMGIPGRPAPNRTIPWYDATITEVTLRRASAWPALLLRRLPSGSKGTSRWQTALVSDKHFIDRLREASGAARIRVSLIP